MGGVSPGLPIDVGVTGRWNASCSGGRKLGKSGSLIGKPVLLSVQDSLQQMHPPALPQQDAGELSPGRQSLSHLPFLPHQCPEAWRD